MAKISCPAVDEIVTVMRNKNYRVFDNPNGHDLNLAGIRTRIPSTTGFANFTGMTVSGTCSPSPEPRTREPITVSIHSTYAARRS